MRNTSKNTSQPSESRRSTRDSFDEDVCDSPFDEPPSLRTRCNPPTDSGTESLSMYQRSVEVKNESVTDERIEYLSGALSEESDQRTPSAYDDRIDDEDGSSGVCGSPDEYSETSSFLSAFQFTDRESVNDWNSWENYFWADLNAFCELPTSNFRSKPLMKPMVWKEYTCFKDTYSTSSATEIFPCGEENCGSMTFWKIERPAIPPQHTKTLDPTGASEVLEKASTENEHFRFESLQEFLQFVTISFHHFLNTRIFVDDPDSCISKDDLNDIDSIACSSLSSGFELRSCSKQTGDIIMTPAKRTIGVGK